MKIQLYLCLLSLFSFLLLGHANVVYAQTGSNGNWQASYWDNVTLAGQPKVQRTEAAINHQWGAGSPAPGIISSERFSARWTGALNLPAGRYRFTVTVDDGARLWVNGQVVIDQWTVQARQVYHADVTVTGGATPVRLEYFENTGQAEIQLNWQALTRVAQGAWHAEYFNNPTLSGAPTLVRGESAIAFNWAGGSPAAGVIFPNTFSARWTRTLDLPAGRYRFTVKVDDGARLWVNGQLVIDQWREQSLSTFTADIDLAGGATMLRMEYFEQSGGAQAYLTWTRLNATIAAGAPLNVWRGEYFTNVTLAGAPVLVRNDPQINFNWGAGSPAPGLVPPDRFSVRWTRNLNLPLGRYRFTVTVDDGVRLWVAGRPVLNAWTVQTNRTLSVDITVAGGATPVRLEYFENTGVAEAQLTWVQIQTTGVAPATSVAPANGVAPNGRTATVVRTASLNVRSGPGVSFARVDALGAGTTVELVGRNAPATWVKIRLANGLTGWVNRSYLNSATPFSALPVTG